MDLNYEDRSKYFKALLLLIGKDGQITSSERKFLLQIGKILNFEPGFCEESIDNLLRNRFIEENIPHFSDSELARTFIREGIRVAFLDELLHVYEFEWLHSICQRNDIPYHWFSEEINTYLEKKEKTIEPPFEIETYLALETA